MAPRGDRPPQPATATGRVGARGTRRRRARGTILTDAFPSAQRGFALGTNQIAGLAGMFVGLVAGGLP